jgi:hypothetical protein
MKPLSDWSKKTVLKKNYPPSIELRDGKGIVVVVSAGTGYKYGWYGRKHAYRTREQALARLQGVEVHFATNGPVQCTVEEWLELADAICEAHASLLAQPAGEPASS